MHCVLGQCADVKWQTRQMEDRIENLLEAGVLDPAKVTRSGLQNACGIAGIMLTTQARRSCLALCLDCGRVHVLRDSESMHKGVASQRP